MSAAGLGFRLQASVGRVSWIVEEIVSSRPHRKHFTCISIYSFYSALTPVADLERFRSDSKAYLEYRRYVENILHRPVEALYQNTEGAKMLMEICTQHMKAKLAKKPEVFEQLLPDFPPGCKRLTPGPGYLEALVEDNVNFISTKIKRVYADGIETEDGETRNVDVIICATGFDGYFSIFSFLSPEC